mmetsp:Transcript_35243/g.40777  ORF Transcript_35243/g.40777 Transcript_35243/m.40777 type:complete len:212 (+) Transcript_35243:1047-1682(+)
MCAAHSTFQLYSRMSECRCWRWCISVGVALGCGVLVSDSYRIGTGVPCVSMWVFGSVVVNEDGPEFGCRKRGIFVSGESQHGSLFSIWRRPVSVTHVPSPLFSVKLCGTDIQPEMAISSKSISSSSSVAPTTSTPASFFFDSFQTKQSFPKTASFNFNSLNNKNAFTGLALDPEIIPSSSVPIRSLEILVRNASVTLFSNAAPRSVDSSVN